MTNNTFEDIGFSLYSLENFEDENFAQEFLNLLLRGPKFAVPKKYGRYEPIVDQIEPHNLSPIIKLWMGFGDNEHKEGLLLMKIKRQCYFMINWEKKTSPSFSAITGGITIKEIRKKKTYLDEYISLIKKIVKLINPVYGKIQNKSFPGWENPLDLQKRLPDISWGSFYGAPYIEMFGKEKILNAPFYKIERLESDHFFLQASESLYEIVPEDVRARIRDYFGEDAYMSGGRWRYIDGKAPNFDFSHVLSK